MRKKLNETEKDRVFNETRRIMESYNELKKYVANVTECKEEVEAVSVKESKTRTYIMLENIERGVTELEQEYTIKGMDYKIAAYKMHYIDGETFESIAEKIDCGKNSPANWIKEINRKMAVKLFGVRALQEL